MTNYYRFLDGIRGLSILWVLLHHIPMELPQWLEVIRKRGDLGVELFFAISGILVTKSLLSTFSKEGSLKSKAKEYFVKRASRIFPPFYATLFTLGFLSFFVKSLGTKLSEISSILFSFPTYTYNYVRFFVDEKIPGAFGIFWSLCFEEQFYLLLLLIFIICKKNVKTAMIALCFSSIVLRLYGAFGNDPEYYAKLQYYTHLRLDAILLGSLYILSKSSVDKLAKKYIHLFGVIVFFLSILSIGLHRYESHLERALNYFLVSLSFTSLIIYLFNIEKSWLKKLFEMKALASIGVVSYEIYLIHQIVNGVMARFAHQIHYSLYISLLFLLSFLAAYFFHRFFSTPMNLFLRKSFLNAHFDLVKGTNVMNEVVK